MMYPFLAYVVTHFTLMLATLDTNDMFENIVPKFALCMAAVILLMSLVFLVARRIRRYDLVDAAWSWAFMTAALVSFMLQPLTIFEFDSQLLITLLVFIWGIRLSGHIVRRIRATDTEDPRYVELRRKWKGNLSLNIFLRIYMVQAVLATLIAIPVIHTNLFAVAPWSAWTFVGAAVWLVGFIIESRADAQLQSFMRDQKNKGKIMSRGLWAFSRHPNYFGELTQWYGILIICLGTPFGWVGIVGPVILTYLILYVSGIPLNEKRFEGRPGWAEYKARTSVLVPLPTKR